MVLLRYKKTSFQSRTSLNELAADHEPAVVSSFKSFWTRRIESQFRPRPTNQPQCWSSISWSGPTSCIQTRDDIRTRTVVAAASRPRHPHSTTSPQPSAARRPWPYPTHFVVSEHGPKCTFHALSQVHRLSAGIQWVWNNVPNSKEHDDDHQPHRLQPVLDEYRENEVTTDHHQYIDISISVFTIYEMVHIEPVHILRYLCCVCINIVCPDLSDDNHWKWIRIFIDYVHYHTLFLSTHSLSLYLSVHHHNVRSY